MKKDLKGASVFDVVHPITMIMILILSAILGQATAMLFKQKRSDQHHDETKKECR